MSSQPNPQPAWPFSTKEGWKKFTDSPAQRPKVLSPKQFDALTQHERDTYERTRLTYMLESAVIRTPQLASILKAARDRIYLNEFKPYARHGLIVTGEATLGKTTTVLRIGRDHERRRRRQQHPAGMPGMIPVVYVTVPPSCGSKDMLVQFADFFGLPHGHRISKTEIMSTVAGVMTRVRTELVIVDEIHNLDLGRQPAAEASDALKQLSEKCPATFIYSGINLDKSGLFSGIRGRQIADRFQSHRMTPFTRNSQQGRAEWDQLLIDFEDTLSLIRQRPGDILTFAGPLFARSGGSIGKLADALHGCALTAIRTGTERLTPAVLRDHGIVPPSKPARTRKNTGAA